MAIRITQGILFRQARADIQIGLRGITDLQQQIATGRRVNRPSDDPAAALRILPLTAELRDLDQLTENVQLARETLNTGSASLEEASSIMQRVQELVIQASNATLSGSDRESIAEEVDQLLQQMVSIANSQRAGRFLFGGTTTDRPPFELVNENGSTSVNYRGNSDSVEVEVAPGVSTQLTLPGDGIFQGRSRGPTVFSTLPGGTPTGAAPGSGIATAYGFDNLEVSFNGLHTNAPAEITAGTGTTNALGDLSYTFNTGAVPNTLSIGGGAAIPIPATDTDFTTSDGRVINLTVTGTPAVTTGTFTAKAGLSIDGGETITDVSDFTTTNAMVQGPGDGEVLYVDTTGIQRVGEEEVRYEGTFDVFTTLISLRDLLGNEAGLEEAAVADRIRELLPEAKASHDEVLDGLRRLGFRSSSMDLLSNRVEGLKISRTESLSVARDTELSDAILELQQKDISYQASLQVANRVISLSLNGFLR